MNTTLARAIPAAAIVLFAGWGAGVASAQVEVVYASTSHSSGVRTAVPGLPGQTFKNFASPYHSPSTARWIVMATTNTLPGTVDQVAVVSQGMTGNAVVQEGSYLDANGGNFYFLVLANPSVADDGSWIANSNTSTSALSTGDHVIQGTFTTAGTTTPAVAAATGGAIPSGGTYGVFSCPNLTALGPSFMATASGAAYTKAGFINGIPVVRMGVDTPTNQGGGTTLLWADLDREAFLTDATGTHWLAKGTLAGGTRVLVHDGAVVAEVGFPLAGMPGNVATIGFTNNIYPRVYLDTSGDWYALGTNNDGASWAVKNGVKIARTGEPIHAGTVETWVSIQDVKGNAHGDYVVLGTTNNSNTLLNQVMAVNGKAVIVRKSDGVDLDGDAVNETNLFIHTASEGRMTPNDDGFLYFSTQMKATPTSTSSITGNNNSLVRLPMCPADIGVQGGLYGTDGLFDNNDFVVFIGYFFGNNIRSDIGKQGGVAGRDGLFDNNDFVVFIDLFFTACR